MKKLILKAYDSNKAIGDRRFHNLIVKNYESDDGLIEIETEDEIYQSIKGLRKPKTMKKKRIKHT